MLLAGLQHSPVVIIPHLLPSNSSILLIHLSFSSLSARELGAINFTIRGGGKSPDWKNLHWLSERTAYQNIPSCQAPQRQIIIAEHTLQDLHYIN